jgi:hypothetical protein
MSSFRRVSYNSKDSFFALIMHFDSKFGINSLFCIEFFLPGLKAEENRYFERIAPGLLTEWEETTGIEIVFHTNEGNV